jgi:hypothetical protein
MLDMVSDYDFFYELFSNLDEKQSKLKGAPCPRLLVQHS